MKLLAYQNLDLRSATTANFEHLKQALVENNNKISGAVSTAAARDNMKNVGSALVGQGLGGS